MSEGLQLKWRYVVDGYVLLTAQQQKVERRQDPFQPSTIAAELAAWKQVVNPERSIQWVFPGRNPGEHLTRRGFDHALRKVASELASVELTHSFRRSFRLLRVQMEFH